jgi:hypothetical protein
VEGDDHVVLLAAAQRVVHQVAVRAHPDAGGVPAQVFREVAAIDHGAVDHVAGDAGIVADQLPSHCRLHAVRTDQRQAAVRAAVAVVHRHALLVLLQALHGRGGADLDAVRTLRAFQQRLVHVRAVDHGIRIAEAGAEGLAGGDAADQGLVQRVVHHHLVGVDGSSARLGPDAKRVERGEGVRPQLDAGADLAQHGGLFEHLHAVALARQCQRGGQPTDAAASDEDGKRVAVGRHAGLRSCCLDEGQVWAGPTMS